LKNINLDNLKPLVQFTTKDSDNQWAKAIIVIDDMAYATNNRMICRTKSKLPDCMLPADLINVMYKVKSDITGLTISDKFVTIHFKNSGWISCPVITESSPAIAPIFDVFKKCIPMNTGIKEAILNGILMQTDGIVSMKKGIIKTNLCKIKDKHFSKNIGEFILPAEDLKLALKMFDRCKFTKELSFFENDNYQAIMAGMTK
jgi:hypothetical protein